MNEFTYEEYKHIINTLKSKYDIVDYREALKRFQHDRMDFSVLRHDVDVELGKAVKLAHLEEELGVKSTYFIMVSSDVYNIYSGPSKQAVDGILKLGHSLGLHFDMTAYTDADRLGFYAGVEQRVLEDLFDVEVGPVSYHCYYKLPTNFKFNFVGINASEEPFMTNVKYFADSYGCWRYGHPLGSDHFNRSLPLHVNCHPEWWSERGESPLLKIKSWAEYKNEKFNDYLIDNIMGLA